MQKKEKIELKQRVVYDNTEYHKAKAKLPKPDGKHCIICGKKLPKHKRKYCSTRCWNRWYDEISPPRHWCEVREKALNRDKHACVKCGITGKQLQEDFKDKEYWQCPSSFLVVDHIIPIALGGKEFDLSNIQTLCFRCNKIKTKRDMGRIAKLRRGIRTLENTEQKQILEFPKLKVEVVE